MKVKGTISYKFILLDIILNSLFLGVVSFGIFWFMYQKYLQILFSNPRIDFSPVPFTLSFWNFTLPILIAVFCLRLTKLKLAKSKPRKVWTWIGEGIITGSLYLLWVIILNELFAYFYKILPEKDMIYFYWIPSIIPPYPVFLVILLPFLNIVYYLCNLALAKLRDSTQKKLI